MALDKRKTAVLTGMCNHEVVIRPFRARQEDAAREYRGHEGIREWVESLDSTTRIQIELTDIEIAGPETAIIEVDVWQITGEDRSGGPTVAVWRFEDGKLREAIGYGTRADALAAQPSY